MVEYFGEKEASILISEIDRLVKVFYTTDANLRGIDMRDMANTAVSDFRKAFPELPHEISNVFVWCYSDDYK